MTQTDFISSPFQLRGLEGQYEGATHPLSAQVVWLGRAQAETTDPAHMLFQDQSVSRAHAALVWSPDFRTYVVHHRSQTNPTFLNGEPIMEPTLLSIGDILSIGRQTVRFEERSLTSGPEQDEARPRVIEISLGQDDTLEEETLEEAPAKEQAPELSIGLRSGGGRYFGSAKESITLRFTPGRSIVEGPLRESDADSYFEVPAQVASALTLRLDSDGSVLLESDNEHHAGTIRTTSVDGLLLEMPVQSHDRLQMGFSDRLLHQGCEVWLVGDDEGLTPLQLAERNAADQQEEPLGVIQFQNGAWNGTTLSILPSFGGVLRLGPGCFVGPHKMPFQGCPLCEIRFDNERSLIRVLESQSSDSLNLGGAMISPGQEASLWSGSGFILGTTIMRWTQPRLLHALSEFELRFGATSFPFSKSLVRIGTAPHCEILVAGKGLAEVTGTLEYTPDGFFYKHLDEFYPALINGESIQVEQEVPVKAGSSLELGLGNFLELHGK